MHYFIYVDYAIIVMASLCYSIWEKRYDLRSIRNPYISLFTKRATKNNVETIEYWP